MKGCASCHGKLGLGFVSLRGRNYCCRLCSLRGIPTSPGSSGASWAIIVILTLAAFLLGIHKANGQEVETGTGLICDTKPQVEQFLSLQKSGVPTETAIEEINQGGNACAIASVAYLRHERVGEAPARQGRVEIVRVTIVGVFNGLFWIRGNHFPQFTIFMLKGDDA
jgi:hypothetical protein